MTGPTERLPRAEDPDSDATVELPRQSTRPGGVWRDLTGAIAIGLCGLAVAVFALQIYAWSQPDVPGPGVAVLLGHVGAALAAVIAQRQADRTRGPQAALGMLLVAVACGIAIWYFWWA